MSIFLAETMDLFSGLHLQFTKIKFLREVYTVELYSVKYILYNSIQL